MVFLSALVQLETWQGHVALHRFIRFFFTGTVMCVVCHIFRFLKQDMIRASQEQGMQMATKKRSIMHLCTTRDASRLIPRSPMATHIFLFRKQMIAVGTMKMNCISLFFINLGRAFEWKELKRIEPTPSRVYCDGTAGLPSTSRLRNDWPMTEVRV